MRNMLNTNYDEGAWRLGGSIPLSSSLLKLRYFPTLPYIYFPKLTENSHNS